MAFSFNGGKDSTVLLHIIRAAIALPLPERTADLQPTDHGKLIAHIQYAINILLYELPLAGAAAVAFLPLPYNSVYLAMILTDAQQ